MSEREPSLTLRIGEEDTLEVTPDNSTLYTFIGRTVVESMEIDNSCVNHIFVRTSEDKDGRASGMYFFREFSKDTYDAVASHMTDHRYPMILNMRVVPECDMRVWMERAEATVEAFSSTIPDEL